MAQNKWTVKAMKEDIQSKIETSDVFLERALLAIYDRQTLDEKQAGFTEHHNAMGFTGVDAQILTNLAQFVLTRKAKGVPEGKRLVGGQIPLARKRMPKYWEQLMQIAKEKKYATPPKPVQMSAL
jgi:hypothetical protein